VLVAADTLARTAVAPAELPLGVFTALVGAPFFIVLLLRRREAWHL
jgi:iron complex transport system permease protein